MQNLIRIFIVALTALFFFTCASAQKQAAFDMKADDQWRAVHLITFETADDLKTLVGMIDDFAAAGINAIILEVDYNFAYQSHPELRRGENPMTKTGIEKIKAQCRARGIELIPEFQCLGHQSWAKETYPLLTEYPHFDLTPGAFANNDSIYCREWDPLNPKVNEIVFALMDELIEAFDPDYFHVGMDEVFLLGHPLSPSSKGKDPAKIYAKAVKDMHGHLVKNRGLQMLMWGDRLIDGNKFGYGEWEAALNGTAPAVDMIPKDIIICDWHYEVRESYPSIPMFLEKGFRVLPCGWKNTEATKALIRYARKQNDQKILGHLFTTWGVPAGDILEFEPIKAGLKLMTGEQDFTMINHRK